MPLKSSHDFKEKYLYVCVGTRLSMRIADILIQNSWSKNSPEKVNISKLLTQLYF